MSRILTINRADLAPLFVHPETQQSVFPAEYSAERQPFHIIGATPSGFFNLSTEMVERADAEQDKTRLQIIPYITLMDQTNGNIFAYTRGVKSGEDRLKAKTSIGLGGHIETSPNSWLSLGQIIVLETIRELEEEVGIIFQGSDLDNMLEGITQAGLTIFTEADEVGTVHLGIALVLGILPESLGKHESKVIDNGRWVSINQLVEESNSGQIELEMWTRLLIMQLQANLQQMKVMEDAAQIPDAANESILAVIESAIAPEAELSALEGQAVKEVGEEIVEMSANLATMEVKPANVVGIEVTENQQAN